LENCLVEAETWYQTAEQADQDQGVPFNPYLVMGRIALAGRQGDHTGVRQRWNQHREALDALQDEKVLPAAVAALAVTLAAPDPDLAGQSVERWLAAHYLLEALCPLARCAPTPKPAQN
jgi:hypothetical protein